MCNILTKQNYFQYEDLQYIQEDGLAMGAPTSSFFSEIYLQYLESTKIFDILLKYHIIRYFRYVDDILTVYKNEVMNIQEELDSFNNITPTMPFTMEEEVNNKINLLDITISKVDYKIPFNMYRKPTATDIIPNDSCHPPEQKLAAIRCLIISLSTYPMNETNKRKKKCNIIKQILYNNKCDVKILNEITHTTDTQTQNEIKLKKKGGGAKFTCVG